MDLFYDNGKWWSRDEDGEIREATSYELQELEYMD